MTRHAAAQRYPMPRRERRHRLLLLALVVPFLVGLVAGPVASPPTVRGDELSNARAQQKQLQRKIDQQKQLIASLGRSQSALAGQISQTRDQLSGITVDLAATRRKVSLIRDNVSEIKASYASLVDQLAGLDAQLTDIEAQETQKKTELGDHKAQLAERIRAAYDAQRTSMLETLLSGASFTDMLAEMSAQLDAATQDQALARQVAEDQATLLSLHQTVESARADTNYIRQQTAVQRAALNQRLADLRAAQAKLRKLEAAASAALASERAAYAQMSADKAHMQRALAAAAAAKKKLQKKIERLVAAQVSHGNIPSAYNGTLRWPMSGTITQEFGCTGFSWEPPFGSCAHYHNGIDIVNAYGTAVRAAGSGRVVYVGWNYADGADPAFIVVIAHSSSLTTWYAHLQPRYPVRAGQQVHKGQVIGYEGSTGHSTGAHLHWMVELNGTFVNPRLFV